jgi:hypothetical protein
MVEPISEPLKYFELLASVEIRCTVGSRREFLPALNAVIVEVGGFLPGKK